MTISFEIRNAQLSDIPQIHAIYAQSVATQTASWEYIAPSIEEMQQRFININANYPYLVAHINDEIIGFAYVSLFRGREGWRFACENSVYVEQEYQGKGIAKNLMLEICEKSKVQGLRTIVAVIGDSENIASIALHKSLGFDMIGTMPKIGTKFDKWLDSVIMQKSLA